MSFAFWLLVCSTAISFALPGQTLAQQDPTANEQLMIYELNRARANPPLYASLNGLGNLLDGVSPRPPLAVNNNLVQSARGHASEMATFNYFAHTSAVTGKQPNEMARDAGYPLHSSLPNAANNIESIAAGYSNVLTALAGLIEDDGVVPPGHRYHLLATGPNANFFAQFREIGCGYASNAGSTYVRYYAIHTGYRNAALTWLTGVAYTDTNSNGRYDLGEGVATTINISGPTSGSVNTNPAGGWSFAVADGTYTVTAFGTGGFPNVSSATGVVVSGQNIEIDFSYGNAAAEVGFSSIAGQLPNGGINGTAPVAGCAASTGAENSHALFGILMLMLVMVVALRRLRKGSSLANEG